MLERVDLRRKLELYRETRIDRRRRFGGVDRRHGILRRGMIDYLVKYLPTSVDEWQAGLERDDPELLARTCSRQFEEHGEVIVGIVRRTVEFNRRQVVDPRQMQQKVERTNQLLAAFTDAASRRDG